eukprot:scaffold149440_cov42-Prasinocladus_malaysianus.AAC.1
MPTSMRDNMTAITVFETITSCVRSQIQYSAPVGVAMVADCPSPKSNATHHLDLSQPGMIRELPQVATDILGAFCHWVHVYPKR